MKLIGFAGRAGAGKTTAAEHLVRSEDYDVVSLATPIKQLARSLLLNNYGYDDAFVDHLLINKTIKIPELGVSMRYLLQTLGTDWGRNMINPFIWVNMTADHIAEQFEHINVVVDDVRFEQEALMIRNFGGHIIHIMKPNGAVDLHSSERGIKIKPGDGVIVNAGSLSELRTSVDAVCGVFYQSLDRILELCHTPCYRYNADQDCPW